MIDSPAELILIDGLAVEPPPVAGGSGAGRERIPLEQGAGDAIDTVRRNRVAGERAPGRAAVRAGRGRGGIEDGRNPSADRFREHALPLKHRWNRRDHGAADGLPLALVVTEEERRSRRIGPPSTSAELVAPELRLRGAGRGKKLRAFSASCRKNSNAVPRNVFVPRLGRQIDDAPVEAAELGRRTVALDLELLDRIDVREEGDLTGFRLHTEMPSKRYSLVRGRPLVILGSGAAGGGGTATPGARLASEMKLRPLRGRSTTRRLSMTWPSPDDSLRRSDASAFTLMASVTVPISNRRSRRTVSR